MNVEWMSNLLEEWIDRLEFLKIFTWCNPRNKFLFLFNPK